MDDIRWAKVSLDRRPDRPTSPWYIRWRDDSGRWRHRFFPTRAAASVAQHQLEARLNQWLAASTGITWAELVLEFIDSAAVRRAGRKHQADIERVLLAFGKLCQPTQLRSLQPRIFDAYFAARRAGQPQRRRQLRSGELQLLPLRPVSDSTIAREYAILHALCQFALSRGYLPRNPLAAVAKPPPTPRRKPPPTSAQWVRLLEVLPVLPFDAQAWHLLILLAATTGVDQTPLLRLELRQLEFCGAEGGHVALLQGVRPKTGKGVLRGLPPLVAERVAARIAALPPGANLLFPWECFQRKQWHAISRAAAFADRFRDLRAAAGTDQAVQWALAAGAHSLGHSSPDVFGRHYADHRRIQVSAALQLELPRLPPLPPYTPPQRLPSGPLARRPPGPRSTEPPAS